MSFLVDPIIFAVPEVSEATTELLDNYITQLNDWSEAFRSNQYEFFVSESCLLALYEAGCFPDHDTLGSLWVYLDEKDIGLHDVIASCKRLFTNVPHLEDRISGLREILIYEDSIHVYPDLLTRLNAQVAHAYQETLGYVAFAKSCISSQTANELKLVTYPMDDLKQVEIEAQVETEQENLELEATVPLLTSPRDIEKSSESTISCWLDLLNQASIRFTNLSFGEGLLNSLKDEQFSTVVANAILDRLNILDKLKTCFDENGNRTNEGHDLIQSYFSGEKALFSDESSTNKQQHRKLLTFKLSNGDEIFCPWHAKISHRTYRIHFSYPIRYTSPLEIVYIGPKLTKR